MRHASAITIHYNLQAGFTLFEFVIYIAITGVVLAVAGAIALNIFFGKAKVTAIEEVSQNARFAMETMTATIRNSAGINWPATGTWDPSLSLAMTNGALNPTIFDVSGGVVRIQQGMGPIIPLTSSEVTVTNFQFFNVSYAGTPGTVRIEMTMEYVNPGGRQEYEVVKTFHSTANARR